MWYIIIVGDTMTEKYIFVNEGINSAYVTYTKGRKNIHSKEYNSFLSCVMRMLVIIYGEEGINKSFSTKNFELFDKELTKYGYSIDNVNKFKMMMDNYYKLDMGQKDRVIKKKNKFFNAIQKLLIDMMVTKNNHGEINLDELVDFYELLFTAKSFDFYRKSYALATALNPYEIDDYFQKFYAINGG
jgi:hypothetical protein